MNAQTICAGTPAGTAGTASDRPPSPQQCDALHVVALIERITQLADELADEAPSPATDMLQAAVCDLINRVEEDRAAGRVPLPDDWFDQWGA